jgi:hypothetical protein
MGRQSWSKPFPPLIGKISPPNGVGLTTSIQTDPQNKLPPLSQPSVVFIWPQSECLFSAPARMPGVWHLLTRFSLNTTLCSTTTAYIHIALLKSISSSRLETRKTPLDYLTHTRHTPKRWSSYGKIYY